MNLRWYFLKFNRNDMKLHQIQNYIKFGKMFYEMNEIRWNSMKLDSMRVYVYDDYFWDVKIQWNHIEMRRKWFSKHLKFNCETSNSIVKHQIRHEITSKSDMKFNCETSNQTWKLHQNEAKFNCETSNQTWNSIVKPRNEAKFNCETSKWDENDFLKRHITHRNSMKSHRNEAKMIFWNDILHIEIQSNSIKSGIIHAALSNL